MSASIIRWEEPVDNRGRISAKAMEWQPVADILRGNPKEWAVVAEGTEKEVYPLGQYVRAGLGPFGPKYSFEAKCRVQPDHGFPRVIALYVRYIGDGTG